MFKNFAKFTLAALAIAAFTACEDKLPEGVEPEPEPEPEPEVIAPFAPSKVVMAPLNDNVMLMIEGVSSNLKYAAGTNAMTGLPAVWNLEDGTVTDFSDFENGSFHFVNNEGAAVGNSEYAFMGKGGAGSWLYSDKGNLVEDEWGSYYDGEAGAGAWSITNDGKTIAGYYYQADYTTFPCLWTSPSTRVDLPVPTEQQTGFFVSGAEARWMSEDGSVIAGFAIDDFATNPLIIWNKNASGSYDLKPVCAGFFSQDPSANMPFMYFEPFSLSANGEWVGLLVAAPYDFENWEMPTYQTARLHLPTGNLEVLSGDVYFSPFGISNDGTCVGSDDDFIARKSYVWNANEKAAVEISTLLPAGNEIASLASVSAGWIAPDNSAVAGFGMDEEFNTVSYIIK